MPRDMVRRKQWYSEWRKGRRAQHNENVRAWRVGIRRFIIEQKMGKSCVRCGIDDYRLLDFHHRDPALKVDRLSVADSAHWSRKKIMEEIVKCDLLCANCHRLMHWEEQFGGLDTI
jgi:hypothetical protein